MTFKTQIAVKFARADKTHIDQGMFFATHASVAICTFDRWCVEYLTSNAEAYATSVGEEGRTCTVIGAVLVNENDEAIAYWNPTRQRALRILR